MEKTWQNPRDGATLPGMGTLKSEGYHIHVYCEPAQAKLCEEIREKMVLELPEIDGAGPVRTRPVGPHPLPMFEAWFKSEFLDRVVRWAMLNRQGLSVMLHPISGNDLEDHRDHSFWLGKSLPLKLEIFN